jgi:hypothetical protein
MGSRSISDLTPKMRELYAAFDEKMREAKIPYMVTCTSRDVLEQMALYVQGRLPTSEVNNHRVQAGLPMISEAENKKVTWTLNSKHITNHFDEDLNNDFSRAFDIAILKNGQPVWDIKVSVNGDEIPSYDEAGAIGESVGLKWGGRFSSPDRPHFEDPD